LVLGKDALLRIQRSASDKVIFTLSGRIEEEGLAELQRLFDLESPGHQLALDLKDVTLADRDAVTFLLRSEEHGIQLENCPPYIREWVERERESNHSETGVNEHTRSARRRSD